MSATEVTPLQPGDRVVWTTAKGHRTSGQIRSIDDNDVAVVHTLSHARHPAFGRVRVPVEKLVRV